eukprot:TRINITY_DN6041_c0_g1_i3.p1 TRINITY_DN6041_c0_g1~~TRINITY_DN6041_c0_g1_i3.p1  ORF type:complete len:325 (+),score=90.13 TRINITY_DN6041_c0_g1_i3:3-977(+)
MHLTTFVTVYFLFYLGVPDSGGFPLGLSDWYWEDKPIPACSGHVVSSGLGNAFGLLGKRNSRKRKNSMDLMRSSDGIRPLDERDRKKLLIGVCQAEAAHEFKELSKIRKSRKHVGCECEHISIGSLSVKQLRQHLQARKVSSSGSKADLVNRLKQILGTGKRQKVCSDPKVCACIQMGLPCHEAVCVCCHSKSLSCLNPEGQDRTDHDVISQQRLKQIHEYEKRMATQSEPSEAAPSRSKRSSSIHVFPQASTASISGNSTRSAFSSFGNFDDDDSEIETGEMEKIIVPSQSRSKSENGNNNNGKHKPKTRKNSKSKNKKKRHK